MNTVYPTTLVKQICKGYSYIHRSRFYMLSFEHVSKFILSDVSLHIPKGQVVGLIGDTGAGKTTLIKLASGLLKPEEGRVSVMGKDPQDNRSRYGTRLSVLITGTKLLEDGDSARSGLDMLRYTYAIPKEEYLQSYRELSDRFGFKGYENAKLKELSTGQRRRVELAAVCIMRPELVILDEPDVGLDEEGKQILEELVREQAREGVTYLITSHNMPEISNMCDRLAILAEGRLMFYGSESVLRSQYLPINTMTITYDGAIPNIDDLPIVRYRMDGNRIAYDYNSRYITASEVLNVLMKQTGILDVKIQKTDLEQIISKLHG